MAVNRERVVSIMRRFAVLCCIGFVFLSTLDLLALSGRHASVTGTCLAQTDRADLMKQSDHRQRIQKRQEDRADEKQVAALGAPDTTSGDYDYLVLIVLAASAVVLALIASQRAKRQMRLRR